MNPRISVADGVYGRDNPTMAGKARVPAADEVFRKDTGSVVTHPAALRKFTWEKHCGGLFELPVAA
jgi:hypothetical protein